MAVALESDVELAVLLAREREGKTCRRPHLVYMADGSPQHVRCGSRLREVCPSCSAIAVGDWAAIIRSGVFDVPSGHVWMMLTLTAPSMGKVHRVPRADHRGALRRCACGEMHTDQDGHLRGVPVDVSVYDYDGTVRWNRDSGRLWDVTRARLRRAMPRLEYAVVREWQARGTLHLHVLVRVPAAEVLTPDVVGRMAASTVALGHEGAPVRWGAQVDCQRIGQGEDTARTVWYVTKAIAYLGKSVADGSEAAVPTQHAVSLFLSAQAAPCAVCARSCREARVPVVRLRYCRAAGHSRQGAASSVVSVSRPGMTPDGRLRTGWSWSRLTRTSQREVRAAWARSQALSEKCRMSVPPAPRSLSALTDPLAAAREALAARRAAHLRWGRDPPSVVSSSPHRGF